MTRPGSLVVAQHLTKRAPVLDPLPTLTRFRVRRFGETTLTFFRADEYDAVSRASPEPES